MNKQDITLASTRSSSTYNGGEVPLESPLKHETLNIAKRVVESYEGLKGYVGVDFVLTEEEPLAIEINPRLTTSYIGLREVTAFNPAQAILNAAIKHRLPAYEPNKGWACFSKTEMPILLPEDLHKTFKMKRVISPPFPVSNGPNAFALISSRGSTCKKAALQLEEARSKLLRVSRLRSG